MGLREGWKKQTIPGFKKKKIGNAQIFKKLNKLHSRETSQSHQHTNVLCEEETGFLQIPLAVMVGFESSMASCRMKVSRGGIPWTGWHWGLGPG